MADPKSGSQIPPKAPDSPPEPLEALTTDPGELSQVQARNREVKQSSVDSAKVKPESSGSDSEEKPVKLSWISVELQDNDGKAVPNEPFIITLSDNTSSEGVTGADGKCKIEGVTAGSAKISFPSIDKREWKPK